jgi:hypothetical protein
MYKSGLYQLGAGINQLGGGNNYNLLGYPVGFYTNTGLTNMNETVSRPLLTVNEYLGGLQNPMYSIGSGNEPFIIDDVEGGRKKKPFKKDKLLSFTRGTLRNTNMEAIKKYQRKNLREKINAIKYPSLFMQDKTASKTKGTLISNNKHLQKMKSLLRDLEKHKNEELSIDYIIKKYKPMLQGMGYDCSNCDMAGAGLFDFLKGIPIIGDLAGAIL